MQLRKICKNLLPNDSSSLSNENIFKGNISKVKHIYQKIKTIPPNLYTNNTGSIANIISRKEEMHLAVVDKIYLAIFDKITCLLYYQNNKTKLFSKEQSEDTLHRKGKDLYSGERLTE